MLLKISRYAIIVRSEYSLENTLLALSNERAKVHKEVTVNDESISEI